MISKTQNKLLFTLFLLIFSNSFSLFAQCESENIAFKDGDKLSYEVYYNVGFIWVEAAEVVFEVKKKSFNGLECFHLSVYGKSLPSYDWAFKVRDYYDTYAEAETLKPQLFIRNTSEGDYKVDNTYYFDYDNKEIISRTSNSNQPPKDSTLVLDKCYKDLLSTFYSARSNDFSTFEVDKNVPFDVVIDNRAYTIYGRLKGYETVEDKHGKKYNCAKLAAYLEEGSMFSGDSEIFVYVTNDKNKVPILVEAPILVGAVKVYLTKAENLKYPLEFVKD